MRATHGPEPRPPANRLDECRRIELALLGDANVSDCVVLERRTTDGGFDRVAYIVPARTFSSVALSERLRDKGLPPVAHLVPISAIPLTANGDPDGERLRALPVNAPLLEQWERRVATIDGVEQVAAVLDDGPVPLLPLHLSDLLPASAYEANVAAKADKPRGSLWPVTADPAVCDGGELIIAADSPKTLDEMLVAASTSPHGLVYLRSDGSSREQSYASLCAAAQQILGGLQHAGLKPGDRVVLQLEDHQEFIETFWACVLGGIVPVPLAVPPTYDKTSGPLSTLRAAWPALDPRVVTVRAAAGAIAAALHDLPGGDSHILALEDLRLGPSGRRFQTAPHDLALLMLTSGSTGVPKAVMLSHRNVLSRSAGSQQVHGFSDRDVSVNWMPLDHVAGLIYFHLRDVYLRCRQIHVPTSAILQNPLRWIDYLDAYRATVTFAPNFAFALVNDRESEMSGRTWDLSCVRMVLNGAEAIVAKTARRFLTLLAPFRLAPTAMHPAWGMSETASGVIYGDRFSLATTTDDDAFVEVGQPIPGLAVRVVDRDDRIVGQGDVGRLQVRGLPVTNGYYGSAQLTREAFTRDGWFNTGDLAAIRDGRVTITGREKDVVIVNSVNYYCHTIEAAVEALDGIETSFTAACAVRPAGANTDRLAVFFRPADPSLIPELVARVRSAVTAKIGIAPDYIVPVDAADIPKTSLGKIQRPELAHRLLEGAFDATLKHVDRLLANANTIPDWFFRKVWRKKRARPQPSRLNREASALIFADRYGAAEAVRSDLERHGVRCTTVQAAETFCRVEPGLFTIDPCEADDYHRLLSVLDRTPDLVVHMWQYGPYTGEAIGDAIAAAQFDGSLSALWLVQALARVRRPEDRVAFTFVASDAQMARTGEPVAYEKAPPIALLKSLPQELPWLECRHLDIPAGPAPQVAALIIEELAGVHGDREVAFRDGQRLVPSLDKITFAPAPSSPPAFLPGGSYVITGGLGGIAERVAEWLLRRFDAKLLLLGRSRLADSRQTVLDRLRAAGGQVAYEAVDVCHEAAVGEIVDAYTERWGQSFGGAIHLAGMYYESQAVDDTPDRFLEVLSAKAIGTTVLQRVFAARDGGFVLSFSSLAAFFGGSNISAYAAANGALEAVAAHFQHHGPVRHYCFAWSAWDDVGFSREFRSKDALRARGYLRLERSQALQSLVIGLTHDHSGLLIGLDGGHRYVRRTLLGEADLLERLVLFYSSSRPNESAEKIRAVTMLDPYGVSSRATLAPVERMSTTAAGSIDRDRLLRSRHGLDAAEFDEPPFDDVERQLADIWRDVLRVSAVKRGDNFFESGGDSLLAARLVARVKDKFGGDFTLRDVFDAETLADLAKRIAPFAQASRAGTVVTADRPLTPGQRSLWFQHQLAPNSGAYNIAFTARVTTPVDLRALRDAFQALADRHEALRTIFPDVRGEPHRQVETRRSVQFDVEDSSRPSADQLLERIALEIRRPFRLATGPLMRVRVFTGSAGALHLTVVFHHIIMDGWSFWICLNELAELYRAAFARQSPRLPASTDQDVLARLQLAATEGESGARHLAFWKAHLGDSVPVLNIPTDRPRPPVPTYEGASERFRLDRRTTERLKTVAREGRATPQIVMLALVELLLQRYAGQDDLMIGYLSSGRTKPEVESVVGYAANLLPLRLRVPEGTFREVLKDTRDTLLAALEHQDYPFLSLVNHLVAHRDSSRSPLFQVLFVYEKPHLLLDQRVSSFIAGAVGARLRLGDLEFESLPFPLQQEGQFDLTFMVVEDDRELCFTIDYKTGLFDRSTIQRMGRHLKMLAESAAADADSRASGLTILTVDERHDLRAWNATRVDHPEGGIHQLFEQVAAKHPDAIALAAGDLRLSYRTLNASANRLAHYLIRRGVTANTPVGLLVERASPDLIIGLLGILKARGAFVALDQAQPAERLTFIYRDSGARVLVTQSALAGHVMAAAGQVIALDLEAAAIDACSDQNPAGGLASDLAYLIYTSGSTGQPKGVLLEHRGLINVAREQQRLFAPGPGSRVLQFASMSFDAAVFDVVMALCSGATLHLAARQSILPGLPLLETLKREQISILTIPPSALANLPYESLPHLDLVLVAGEACPAELVEQWAPGRRFFNLYGPTEATIWATYARCFQEAGVPAIGRPLANTQAHVLDANLREVPVGLPGELFLGGAGLARGYVNRPELTARSFIAHPLAVHTGGRLYKTGDIVRRTSDGELHYVGRVDDQVKLRGFRIEPGEIAAALSRHHAVNRAVVVVREDTPGDRRLVAYVVPEGPQAPSKARLREFLQVSLPDYMVPAAFVLLDDFPLTPSGKVDRRALPAPVAEPDDDQPSIPPSTEMEQLIASVWRTLLKTDRVGVDDNFFDIGGNSLLMAQVHARLSEVVAADLSIVDLFQFPTIRTIGARIAGASPVTQCEERSEALMAGQARLRDQARRRQAQPADHGSGEAR